MDSTLLKPPINAIYVSKDGTYFREIIAIPDERSVTFDAWFKTDPTRVRRTHFLTSFWDTVFDREMTQTTAGAAA